MSTSLLTEFIMQALKFLQSDELKDEVQKGITTAQRRGITGVPFTIVNSKFGISGGETLLLHSRASVLTRF